MVKYIVKNHLTCHLAITAESRWETKPSIWNLHDFELF
jgi:hypothetical protein